MNAKISWTDNTNIELEVTLNSGSVHPEKLKCSLFRIYSEPCISCNAHASINFDEINGLISNGKRVEPTNYSIFTDPKNQKWKINDYKKHSPLEAPGLIFCLTKI